MAEEEEVENRTKKATKNMNPITNSWSRVVGNITNSEGLYLSNKEQSSNNVKIIMEDIKEEIKFWNSAVICYILGSNPPQTVMEGYFKRIWG